MEYDNDTNVGDTVLLRHHAHPIIYIYTVVLTHKEQSAL